MFALGDALWTLLDLGVVLVGLGTATGFLARAWWIFELTSHFRVQYFIVLAASGPIFLLGGRPGWAAAAGSFALANLALILPLYARRSPPVSGSIKYRALLINVLQANPSHGEVLRFIQTARPDFVVLLEVNREWLEDLKSLERELPHRISHPREDNYGLATWSRLPLIKTEIHYPGPQRRPATLVRVDADGVPLTLIGAHPPPPKQKNGAEGRNRQLVDLAELVRAQDGEVLLMGDLNLTPWSPYYQDLLQQAGLRDSRVGFGIQPTWPTANPFLRVPIDHILYTPGATILHCQTGAHIGSDHFPLLVDFSLRPIRPDS